MRQTSNSDAQRSKPETPFSDSCAEDRIQEAMELYLEELESGSGPLVDDFLQRFPGIADQLRSSLEGLRFLHGVAPEMADNTPTKSHADSLPASLGDFRLIRPIGRGGMGIVYEAEQLSLGRKVALKILPAASALDDRHIVRFKNEALIAGQLSHPNIVNIIGVGDDRGIHFFAMELVVGRTLAELVDIWRKAAAEARHRRNKRDLKSSSYSASSSERDEWARIRQATEYCLQITDALENAHQLDILHRDVKPSNVIIDSSNKALLMDFGLARVQDTNLTMSGDVIGTIRYMSPEQALGQRAEIGPRSDIYSLGAMLYELVTLRPMLEGDEPVGLLESVVAGRTVAPRSVNSVVPRDLETIILKATEARSSDRYMSASDLAKDLTCFLHDLPIVARRPSISDRVGKWARRHRTLAGVGAVATILLCSVLAVSTWLVWNAQSRAQTALTESRRHAEHVEGLLYTADIQLAYQAWDEKRIDQVGEILHRQRPESGKVDRRGAEWFYLRSLARVPHARTIGHHNGSANELSVFPDGKRVATVGDDGMLCIWHLESGGLVKSIKASNDPLYALAISPDGNTIVTGNRFLKTWDVETAKLDSVIAFFMINVEAIAFSTDGSLIAAGTRYHKIMLYTESGELLKTVNDDAAHTTLEFTPDGKHLIAPSRVASDDGRGNAFIRIWPTDMSIVEHDIGQNFNFGTLATYSKQGFYLIGHHTASEEQLRLFDAKTCEELLLLPAHRDRINAIAVSPNGKTIAAGYVDGTINYWQIERSTGNQVKLSRTVSQPAHDGRVWCVRFASDTQLVTCGGDGSVRVWELNIAENPTVMPIPASDLDVASDGRIATYQRAVGFRILAPDGNAIVRRDLPEADLHGGITFFKDGNLLVTYDKMNREIHLRDGHSGNVLQTFRERSDVESLSFSPSGKQLAATTYKRGLLRVFELEARTLSRTISLGPDGIYFCMYSPDGKHLVCGGEACGIRILDAASLATERSYTGISQPECITFNAAGTMLASGHHDASIRLWDFPVENCEPSS